MNSQVKLPLEAAAEVEAEAEVKAGRVLIENGGAELIDPFPPEVVKSLENIAAEERKLQRGNSWHDSFDWAADDSVVISHQPATAIYRNEVGSIVIRQEACWNEEIDSCVTIAQSNAQSFLDALCDVLGIGSVKGSR